MGSPEEDDASGEGAGESEVSVDKAAAGGNEELAAERESRKNRNPLHSKEVLIKYCTS